MSGTTGRGAQVVFTNTSAQRASRGGYGRTMQENMARKASLEADGTASDGSTVDGSTLTGLHAEDVIYGRYYGDDQWMNGPLTMLADPVNPMHVATKQYVDARVGGGPFLPLTGGTVSGPTTFNDMVSMTGSYTWAAGAYPGTNPAIYQSLTYSGTPTAGFPGAEGNSAPINLIQLSESLNYTINPGGVSALEILHSTTGGNGGRNALLISHGVSGTMGTTNTNYCAAQIFSVYGGNVTGAAAGAGNGRGDTFGLGVQMQLYSGSFLHGATAIEVDINPSSGASVDYLVGAQIVNFGVAGQLANVFDCMHLLATSNPATNKRATYGYYFGNPQAGDGNGFPITATGTMIGSKTGSTGIGIDFSAVTFATAFLKGPGGFQVDNDSTVHTNAMTAPSGTFTVNSVTTNVNTVLGFTATGTNYIVLGSAGTGLQVLQGGNPAFRIANIAGTPPANYFGITPALAGGTVWATAQGTDTNITLGLNGQGTGGVNIGSRVGFNNTTPIAKPTVTGAKGSNAALASLIAALSAYGLITDTTTA